MHSKLAAVAASATLCLASFASTAVAQDKPRPIFVYSSYFHCNANHQADDAVNKLYKGVYDAATKDGTISSWGWLAHQTGGTWTRVAYFTAPDMESLFKAMDTLNERTGGKQNEAVNKEFGQACRSHEDYVWRMIAGNESGQRGSIGFSTYLVCDPARENQVDALVQRVFAPTYDKLVADGKLTSWGWHEHIIGGKYRRLATMTAKDLPSLMEARNSLVQSMMNDPLAATMDEICSSHSDYIWMVEHQAH